MRSSVSLALVVGLTLALVLVFTLSVTDAKRFGGSGGGKRRPTGGGYRPKPAPAPKPKPAEQHDFLNAERGHSTSHTNHNPSAPQQHSPQGNRPIGFEQFGAGNTHGSPQIGFDKVNSQVQNRPGGSFTPNAPPYPGAGSGSQVGPPPAYHPQGQGQVPHYGGVEHPPAYPGRPVNAPPAYTPNQANPHYGQTFGNPPPQQGQYGFPFQGQGYHGQQNYGNTFGSSYPQQPSFGQGYHPTYPGYGGGGAQSFGGSPFGTSGYNGNPYYSPNNFGYSSNPGYFGQGYHGHYDDHKKSRFGGLPIPIPIPIPIGGFGGGHGSGFGGGHGSGFGSGNGGSSYNHRLLDTFIKDKEDKSDNGNSTSVFVLNNSTVTPCTTDHFPYGKLNITVMSCTAEYCTGVKVTTTTKVKDVESRHSAWLTMCLEKNETWTASGDKVQPSVSELQRETITVCRNLTVNSTQANSTVAPPTASPATTASTTDASTTDAATTDTNSTNSTNSTTVCEDVHCSWVEMCMTAIEIVDDCSGAKCPFRRSGYRPCVTIKMCRSPNSPLSTFASLNTTLYTADEYDHRQSQHHATNLTLISYHPPVIFFNPNCSQNGSTSTSGCPPPTSTSMPSQCPAGSTSCSPVPGTAPNSTSAVTDDTGAAPALAPATAPAPANDTSTPAPSL